MSTDIKELRKKLVALITLIDHDEPSLFSYRMVLHDSLVELRNELIEWVPTE